MRDALNYYGLLLRTAFRHSLDLTQYITFVLFLIIGAIAWFAPSTFGKGTPDVNAWAVVVCVLGSVMLLRLLLAPYWIFQDQRAQVRKLEARAPDAMRFVFPNDAANRDSKGTLFRESYKLLPIAQQDKYGLSQQTLYVAIENLTERTLRNVRVVIELVNHPDRVVDLHCRFRRTNDVIIDVQPNAFEYFLFGQGFDKSSHPGGVMMRQAGEVDTIFNAAQVSAFYLATTIGGSFPLFHNDGYVVRFSAYADDVAPISAAANLDLKSRIELRLVPGPHVFDPEGTGAALATQSPQDIGTGIRL